MTQTLKTKRLLLCPVTETDTDVLHQLLIQPAVRRYLCDDQIMSLSKVQEMVTQSVAAFQVNQYGLWLAKLQQTTIGFTGYWPFFEPPAIQLIYGLTVNHWGQGLATEMAQAMVNYGFKTHGFEAILASANVPNLPSIAVMQRLGMQFDQLITVDGQELVLYQLSKHQSVIR